MKHCRSCGAAIIWLKTKADKFCPVDAESVKEGETVFDPEKHISHFASCPDAKKWRKNKTAKQWRGKAPNT